MIICSELRVFIWQMGISNDEAEEEYELFMVAVAAYAKLSTERLPYAPRRIPVLTGLQWVEQKEANAQAFYSMFRMRRSVFYPLLDLLVERYGLTSTCNMSSKEALALFLWTLGTRSTTDNVAGRFEHSRSTVCKKFYEVLDCVDRMAGDYIRPKDRNFTTVHPKLQTPRFWPHFKDAIGAIDGTHIKVIVPKELEIQHMNRKGYTSQNVMAICDFDLRFTFVVPGWPGSVHDTRVWADAQVSYAHYPHAPTGNLLRIN
jgi:hypothetical protein